MPPRLPLPRVVTSAGLAIAAVSNDFAERAVREGRWQRGARGVYLTHVEPPSDPELCHIARAHVGDDLIVTGLVVLRSLGLPWLPQDRRIHVLVGPDCRRTSSVLVQVTRTSAYDALVTMTLDGMRYAEPARAVVDAARSCRDLRNARGVVLGAVGRRAVTVAALTAHVAAGQRNGSAHTTRAVIDATRGCASPPEAELVDALVGRGTPFYVNPQVWVDDVWLGNADIWPVEAATGGEVESQERHGDAAGTENTYDRHERFTAAGLELVHLSVGRIRRDVNEAAGHLLARVASGQPAPPGLRLVPTGPLLR